MKVLNLDKVGKKEVRKLILAGVEHVVQEMTVDNFIETTRAAERIANETSLAVQVEATTEMILRSIPTATRAGLGGLSLETLQAIVAFVRGDDVDGIETTKDEAGN
jgi:hypothetical protein